MLWVRWPSSGHPLAAVMIPPGPALGDLYWQQPIMGNIFRPLSTPEHTYIAHFHLLSWCLCTLLGAHFPNICIEIENRVSHSLIPRVSTVPNDPTPQCPPTHLQEQNNLFLDTTVCLTPPLPPPHTIHKRVYVHVCTCTYIHKQLEHDHTHTKPCQRQKRMCEDLCCH